MCTFSYDIFVTFFNFFWYELGTCFTLTAAHFFYFSDDVVFTNTTTNTQCFLRILTITYRIDRMQYDKFI